MKISKYLLYFISFWALVFISCGDKTKSSKDAALLAALPMIRSDIPILDTENRPSTTSEITQPTGLPYQNKFIPQNFSLQIPVNPQNSTSNQVDLSKCYIDQNVDSGDLMSNYSRLCGIAFDQVKLELHALFLDLALPHIRALCQNKLPTCDLSGESVDITISEPVMNKIQRLYEFYAHVGLQSYFQYNGYELKNGVKFPLALMLYEEVTHPVYEYRAVFKQRVISTLGTQVVEIPGAADISIYWNKTRKNILFQFQTNVEAFGFKVNARRVYDYSTSDAKIFITTELDYWTDSEYAFRFGQSSVIQECASGDKCIQQKGVAGFFIGNDSEKNGLSGSEVYYHSLRYSTGIADNYGGVLTNAYPESGKINEMFLYKNQNEISFQLEPGDTNNKWAISSLSPSDDLNLWSNNNYWKNFVDTNGDIKTNRLTSKITVISGIPQIQKMIFWQATDIPTTSLPLNGFGVTGNNSSVKLRFNEIEDYSYYSQFLPDGTRNYLKQ